MSISATSAMSAQQRSWADRLAEVSAGEEACAIEALLLEPFPSALLGAALYARQPCLLLNTRILLNWILDGDEAMLRSSCLTLLRKLCADIRSHDIKETEGFVMFFRLLVEPFALMNQCTAFHPTLSPSTSATNCV